MSSNTVPQRPSELRSGGKIIRPRRTTGPKTPYDRPSPRLSPNSGPQNPNWLSRLILSPTRMITSGAGKFLSVFRYDSSSSASSDSDSSSEDGDADADDVTSQGAHLLDNSALRGTSSQVIERKSEPKRTIERLLMQETFSREECDRLTYIIQSRVVDSSVAQGIDGRLTEIPDSTVGSDAHPVFCGTAITEAKKWLEEKKLGSNSKSELEYGTCTLNTAMLPQVTEGDVGSPVDLAKSYMQARPPWALPSMINIHSPSPSPAGIQLFKDETPYSFGGDSLSISKLIRDSPAGGSWNIQKEIQKVRSKATEDLLRTRPSVVDWSTLSSDVKSPRLLVPYKAESVSQVAQDGLQIDSSPLDPTASVQEQSEDLRVTEIMDRDEGLLDRSEGKSLHGQRLQPSEDLKAESQGGENAADGLSNVDRKHQHLTSSMEGDAQDSRLLEINRFTLEEVAVKNGPATANGFPSGLRLSGEQQEGEQRPSGEEQRISVQPGEDKTSRKGPVDESDTAITASQDSSSIPQEGLLQSQEPTVRTLNRKAGKNKDVVAVTEKQQFGKRRYVRRGKGRG